MKVNCKQEGLNSAISTGGNLPMFIYRGRKEKKLQSNTTEDIAP